MGDTIRIKIEGFDNWLYPYPFVYLFQGDRQVAKIEEYDYKELKYVLEANNYEIEVVQRAGSDCINLNYLENYILKFIQVGGRPKPAIAISYPAKVYGALTTHDGRSRGVRDNWNDAANQFADTYSFSGNAGDTLVVQFYNPSETFGPAFELYDKNGRLVNAPFLDPDIRNAIYDDLQSRSGLLYDYNLNFNYMYYWRTIYILPTDGTYELEAHSGTPYSFTSRGIGPYILSLDQGTAPESVFMTYGGAVEGQLSATDSTGSRGHYSDYYDFIGNAGDSVLIDLTSPQFDCYLYLRGPDGGAIGNTEELGSSGHVWIGRRLQESGNYTVEVTSFNPLRTGSYSLSIDFISQASFFSEGLTSIEGTLEPNDLETDAYGPLINGLNYEAYIVNANDVDWYYFLFPGGELEVTLSGLPEDYDIQLYDRSSPDKIAISEKSETADELISVQNLPAGRYYLVVYSYYRTFNISDSYLLRFAFKDPELPDTTGKYEPNDSLLKAYGPLVSGQAYEAFIERGSDVDWYYFDIMEDPVSISLSSLPDDYDLQLFKEGKNACVAKSDQSDIKDELIDLPHLSSGRYYAVVYSAGAYNTSDSYTLKIDYTQPSSETPSGVMCDFNKDGKKNITDVIALLLFQRSKPGDLGGDFSKDGKSNVADAIAMLLAQRNNNCPDKLAVLSSAVDYKQVEVIAGLSAGDIEYLEQLMAQLNLTPEEAAAFRQALYGNSGKAALPKAYSLSQNSPNPFNPATTISYSVPEGRSEVVTLKVHDLRGRLVRTLVSELREAGSYSVFWDGTDEAGRKLSSGVYFYRMNAGGFCHTRKMVLLK